jgi:alcohol dehydrogenase class IV
MALAATYAGLAFTRANVGYVHAIAHQFGGKYHTPHGLANAIMLPHVLKYSLPAITGRLACWRCAPNSARKANPKMPWRKSSSLRSCSSIATSAYRPSSPR